MVLKEFQLDITPILTGAGIVGLAVGFGAQTLVRDIISGFFLILENQVRVGDEAAINGTPGLVEAINLRTIVLRDIEGTVHVFPNGAINTLANRSKDYSYYVIDLAVSYYDDSDRVAEVLREVAAELQSDPAFGPSILEPIEILGIDAFTEWAARLKARIKTVPLKQWEVGRELRRRIVQGVPTARLRDSVPGAGDRRAAGLGKPGRADLSDRSAGFSLHSSVPGRRGGGRLLPSGLLHDLDARAGAHARGAGGHHRLQPVEIPHTAGSLHAHVRPDHAAHEGDVGGGRASGREAGGRLHEVRPGRLRQRAGGDLLVVGEERGFDDDLADRAALPAGARPRPRCRTPPCEGRRTSARRC